MKPLIHGPACLPWLEVFKKSLGSPLSQVVGGLRPWAGLGDLGGPFQPSDSLILRLKAKPWLGWCKERGAGFPTWPHRLWKGPKVQPSPQLKAPPSLWKRSCFSDTSNIGVLNWVKFSRPLTRNQKTEPRPKQSGIYFHIGSHTQIDTFKFLSSEGHFIARNAYFTYLPLFCFLQLEWKKRVRSITKFLFPKVLFPDFSWFLPFENVSPLNQEASSVLDEEWNVFKEKPQKVQLFFEKSFGPTMTWVMENLHRPDSLFQFSFS